MTELPLVQLVQLQNFVPAASFALGRLPKQQLIDSTPFEKLRQEGDRSHEDHYLDHHSEEEDRSEEDRHLEVDHHLEVDPHQEGGRDHDDPQESHQDHHQDRHQDHHHQDHHLVQMDSMEGVCLLRVYCTQVSS